VVKYAAAQQPGAFADLCGFAAKSAAKPGTVRSAAFRTFLSRQERV
jgi:hypothetical protein